MLVVSQDSCNIHAHLPQQYRAEVPTCCCGSLLDLLDRLKVSGKFPCKWSLDQKGLYRLPVGTTSVPVDNSPLQGTERCHLIYPLGRFADCQGLAFVNIVERLSTRVQPSDYPSPLLFHVGNNDDCWGRTGAYQADYMGQGQGSRAWVCK